MIENCVHDRSIIHSANTGSCLLTEVKHHHVLCGSVSTVLTATG